MAPRSLAIHFENVSKTFEARDGEVEAIARLDLVIEAGEFCGILGPSGCGKTTLLRLAGGLDAPTAGSVTVGGRTPVEARAARQFGWVFQDPVLLPWRTVEGNIRLPTEIYDDALTDSRLAELVDLVGLAGFGRAYPRELSGGMRSRVALARALSVGPAVLLMDEPFGDLDEITRDRMNQELLDVWAARGCTVAFVTHSISEAVFLADRVVVLQPRPARIAGQHVVPLARPRRAELRGTVEFLSCVARERLLLEEVSNASRAGDPACTSG